MSGEVLTKTEALAKGDLPGAINGLFGIARQSDAGSFSGLIWQWTKRLQRMSGFFMVFLILLYRKIYFYIAIANSNQILADFDFIIIAALHNSAKLWITHL